MTHELTHDESIQTQEQVQYTFVVDIDLMHVGGGSAVNDY